MSDTYESTRPLPGMTVRAFLPGTVLHDRTGVVSQVLQHGTTVRFAASTLDDLWVADDDLYWDSDGLVRCLLAWMRAGAPEDS